MVARLRIQEEERELNRMRATIGLAFLYVTCAAVILLAQNAHPTEDPKGMGVIVQWFQHPVVVASAFASLTGGLIHALLVPRTAIREMIASVLVSVAMGTMIFPLVMTSWFPDLGVFWNIAGAFCTGLAADNLLPKVQNLFSRRVGLVMDQAGGLSDEELAEQIRVQQPRTRSRAQSHSRGAGAPPTQTPPALSNDPGGDSGGE